MKKTALLLCCILMSASGFAQQPAIENLIVVTTDGFRWREVFSGLDRSIAKRKKYNEGAKQELLQTYGQGDAAARRQRLLPFLWDSVARKGSLYGNRKRGSKVFVANPYRFSYPGYSEIFCGFVDRKLNSNDYGNNPNTNVLAFLNRQPGFSGRVFAFGAWNAFDRILNEAGSGIPVVCNKECLRSDTMQQLARAMTRDELLPFGDGECLDVFTHYEAMKCLKEQHPRVLYIGYGETDEWAHEGKYRHYLDAAHRVDGWLRELWDQVQRDPEYRNKTAIFVTVDHGRGNSRIHKWTSHGKGSVGSKQTWFAVMGPGIAAGGEMHGGAAVYERQFAQTFARLLGLDFSCEHPVAPGLSLR